MDASAVPHFEAAARRPPRSRLAPVTGIRGGKQVTMVDVTAGQGAGAPGGGFPSFKEIRNILIRGDLAAGVRHPHHSGGADSAAALDRARSFPLAISITLSILILMTSLFIQAPLEFSSFPTILLISTHAAAVAQPGIDAVDMSRGHEGTDAAAQRHRGVRQFRGWAGNFVIGLSSSRSW